MDINEAEKQINKADSFITALWKFLGRHWGKLIVLSFLFLVYKFCVMVGEEIELDRQRELNKINQVQTH